MDAHLHEWIHLLLRWIHFIVGIAWIGASFYFNWLENNLERRTSEAGIAGTLWAVHGGGFYHLKKYRTGPEQLPPLLHWFKWEAYATWVSGVALLVLVYYLNAHAMLVHPEGSITAPKAVVLGVIAVFGAWFVYHFLCRMLGRFPWLLGATLFAWLTLLAWMLEGLFSGRAAYLHVGAAMGTMMVGNVFFVIIPAQKEMVGAVSAGKAPPPRRGADALLRSRHNNYLTLPVLFTMISSHFPATYGHPHGWAVLALIAVAGVLARHYFNVRRAHGRTAWAAYLLLPLAAALLVALAWVTRPAAPPSNGAAPRTADIAPIVQRRCAVCHGRNPTWPGIAAAPVGLMLDTPRAMTLHAARIHSAAVVTRTMPPGNVSGLTDAERARLKAWYHGGARP